MKELLEFLVKSVVAHPEEVVIRENQEENLLTFKLKVNPDDLKIVIGREGRTIKAIRHLLRVKAAGENKKFNLILEESV